MKTVTELVKNNGGKLVRMDATQLGDGQTLVTIKREGESMRVLHLDGAEFDALADLLANYRSTT